MFAHLPELIGLLVLGLIIFGPKRMIELGGQLGRALRELQSAMKDMSWNPLGEDSPASRTPSTTLGKLSQLAQDMTTPRDDDPTPAASPHVVETTATTAQPTGDTPAE